MWREYASNKERHPATARKATPPERTAARIDIEENLRQAIVDSVRSKDPVEHLRHSRGNVILMQPA